MSRNLKNTFLFVGFLLVTFTALKYLKKSPQHTQLTESSDVLEPHSKVKSEFVQLKTGQVLKTTTSEEILASKSDELTHLARTECQKLFLTVTESPLENNIEFITNNFTSPQEAKCLHQLNSKIKEMFSDVLNYCKKERAVSQDCKISLLNLKSALVAHLVGENPNYSKLDSATLLHLVNHQISQNTLLQNTVESVNLVSALLEKQPHYLAGHKLKLFLLSQMKADQNRDVDFSQTIDSALQLAPEDSGLINQKYSIKIGDIQTALQRAELIQQIDQKILENPNEWVYYYLKAKVIWADGAGSFDQTLFYLRQALSRDQQNLQIQMTLQNFSSSDQQVRKYPFVEMTGVGIEDLN